ncbi:SDR family NAD(P)-dependent oxidoreductase [Acidisoma cladoniae]|uniref:SDR family NAD(P)-dependent oxidoreductase n=1 Tax=Acidisoma cladoniae TaxID=3040935 RepID=UPI00254C3304|nr:SDR family oxidoreductase [Acidisoma sp. PAMC 29798]
MRLKGKIAVVTGGSQGIGAAVCERFAREGAKVFVVASSDVTKAQLVVDRILAAGGDAVAAAADVTSVAELDALMRQVGDRLDILVNSAGVFYPTPLGSPEGDVSRMIDINLKGTFLAISAAAPLMKAGHAGKIINLSSCIGYMAFNTYSIYCATKAGIIMMTRALALELAPHGINVNAIAPGNTATPINENIRTQPEFAGFLQAMGERTPSGQTYSSVEDIANLAMFLASDESRAMHGSTVVIDEGFTAGM